MEDQSGQPRVSAGAAALLVADEQAAFMRKVYGIMGGGLATTALVAMWVSQSETALRLIFGNPLIFFGLIIGELVMVWTFSSMARRMSAIGAGALFFSYAAVS